VHVKVIESEAHNLYAYATQEVSDLQDNSFNQENSANKDVSMNWDLMTKLQVAGVSGATRQAFLRLISAGFGLSHDEDYWSEAKCDESARLLKDPALEEFVPDTSSTPIKTEIAFHTLIGQFNLHHYESTLGNLPVRWTIGSSLHQKQMKVWVHKVFFTDEEKVVNSYGLYPTNIGPAFFNNKPFDYTSQSMERGVTVNDTYNDMTSVLPQGIPFLNSFVRNVTNQFRELALAKINAFTPELKASVDASGSRYYFRGPYTFRSWWGSHSWQHYVTSDILAADFSTNFLYDKAWLRYLFRQIVGSDSQNKSCKYDALKKKFSAFYTIEAQDTVHDLEYAL